MKTPAKISRKIADQTISSGSGMAVKPAGYSVCSFGKNHGFCLRRSGR